MSQWNMDKIKRKRSACGNTGAPFVLRDLNVREHWEYPH